MRFIWNAEKSAWTLRQRGFSFADATRVFDDPLRWIERARSKDGEERWLTIGALDPVSRLVAVIYTEREVHDKKTIRIISARPASGQECRKIARRNAQD